MARRGRGKTKKNKLLLSSNEGTIQEHVDVDKVEKRLRQTASDLKCEAFYGTWRDELRMATLELQQRYLKRKADSQSLNCSSGQMQCVCYGLGSFSSCASGRYQLAMLMLLLDALEIRPSDCSVFDPVFSSGEKAVLSRIGLTVLIENEEGKRQALKPTFFYLMHCGKALYNNLLWKNWSKQHLTEILIVGNSFCGMKERTIDREFNRDYRYISQITAVCKENLLPCPSHMTDVFSDTAVLTFPAGDLDKLSESTWTNPSEPQYEYCKDLEIVCKDRTEII
uniref:SRR1-like domain-containing protein n=1 Tax=Knipowitschia caucasica TaxID=637954 RepID=A0AAV2MR66_KNICA